MSEFKPINTQEEFDAAIKDRLERERAKYADYDDLKKRAGEADKAKTQLSTATAELERLKADANATATKLAEHDKTVAALTERATKAEKSLLRRKVAEEAKLPASIADRLRGETEDDLRKDAKTLAQFVQPTQTAPLATVEKPHASGSKEAREAAVQDAFSSVLQQMKGDI